MVEGVGFCAGRVDFFEFRGEEPGLELLLLYRLQDLDSRFGGLDSRILKFGVPVGVLEVWDQGDKLQGTGFRDLSFRDLEEELGSWEHGFSGTKQSLEP